MKLPAIIKRDTAAALVKTSEDLTAVEAQVAALQTERQSELLDAEASEIAELDERILERRRTAAVLENRLMLLEQRQAEEREEQAKRRYEQAVAAIEPRLARRTEAAIALEKEPTPANARNFVAANSAVMPAWPAGVPWPDRVYWPAYLSVERLARRVHALEPGRGHADKRPRQPGEYLTRFLEFTLAGFGAEEAEQARALLDGLRHAHDAPVLVEPENEEAA
jgi:hypothetical protein